MLRILYGYNSFILTVRRDGDSNTIIRQNMCDNIRPFDDTDRMLVIYMLTQLMCNNTWLLESVEVKVGNLQIIGLAPIEIGNREARTTRSTGRAEAASNTLRKRSLPPSKISMQCKALTPTKLTPDLLAYLQGII